MNCGNNSQTSSSSGLWRLTQSVSESLLGQTEHPSTSFQLLDQIRVLKTHPRAYTLILTAGAFMLIDGKQKIKSIRLFTNHLFTN